MTLSALPFEKNFLDPTFFMIKIVFSQIYFKLNCAKKLIFRKDSEICQCVSHFVIFGFSRDRIDEFFAMISRVPIYFSRVLNL